MRFGLLLSILFISLGLSACGTSSAEPTISASEVHLSCSQMDIVFERTAPFTGTYMVFGGLDMDRPDAVSKITLVGLDMADAKPIYSRYPDFHRCSSPGASMAQAATRQMDIVPANADVLASLQDTLAQHEASLGSGGDRVCVKLRGSLLNIASATAQEMDITAQLPAQLMHEYFLVEGVEVVDAKLALEL